jgi:hypothetical protein
MSAFKEYRPRKIEFNQLATTGGWSVKVYTITHRSTFEATEPLKNAVRNLPEWLRKSSQLQLPTYGAAFLIVHEGRDGVWTLINWWIGGEMLQSITFFTDYKQPDEFKAVPKEGFMSCVWELAVTSFERAMWVECVLKKAAKPDIEGYLKKYISQSV